MDGLTFTVKVLEVLVWPAFFLFVALKFQAEFRGILQRITKVKAPGFETEIGRELKEVAKEAEVLPAIPVTPPKAIAQSPIVIETEAKLPLPQEPVIHELIKDAPSKAIAAVWFMVENELMQTYGTHTPEGLAYSTPRDLVKLVDSLRRIRNEVTHGAPLKSADAEEFVQTADRLILELKARRTSAGEKQ